MKVELLNYTQDALELLIYTKDTRMQAGQTIEDIKKWSDEKKQIHLAYMFKTIKGAFEFVDYVFKISEVSRAFTHQLVRTRTASFAQESMRAVDVRDANWTRPAKASYDEAIAYDMSMHKSIKEYASLIDQGVAIQDARGLLPTAIHTSILMKANLRTLNQMAEHRLCTRTQGEYQDVFKAIKKAILLIHPWVEPLLQPACVQYGVCAFPNYTKCPVQRATLEYDEHRKYKISQAWIKNKHRANPVANREGMTM